VATRTVSHDSDRRMAAQMGNAVAKATPLGDLVSKDKNGSLRKIDAAVAAIVVFDRAAWHRAKRANVSTGRRAVVL